jgi:hypothetical protein
LGINSVSTEAVNGYELGLLIGLVSYQVGFDVIGSDPLRYTRQTTGLRWSAAGPLGEWLARPSRWAGWVSVPLG